MARIQVHVGQSQFVALTSAQMDADKTIGITGYVVYVGSIAPLNPPATGQTVPATILTIENAIKTNVALAHGKGLVVGLRVSVAHYYNGSTPFAPWFDGSDTAKSGGPKWSWATGDYYTDDPPLAANKRYSILATWRFLAEMCERQLIDEVMFDQEEYAGAHTTYLDSIRAGSDQFNGDNGHFSWRWDYPADRTESHNNPSYAFLDIPANTHTEAETRAQARTWGGKLSQVMRTACPELNISVYYNRGITGNQWEWEWEHGGNGPNPYRVRSVQTDFWGGFLQDFVSTPGGRFRSCDAGFYRTAAFQPNDLTAMQAARDKVRQSYLTLVSNPSVLHPRLFIDPMRWPEQGDNAITQPYPGDAIATQWMTDGATKAEHALEVYAHNASMGTHWTDPGIRGGIKAASPIAGPQPATPPYTQSGMTANVTLYFDGVAQQSAVVTIP